MGDKSTRIIVVDPTRKSLGGGRDVKLAKRRAWEERTRTRRGSDKLRFAKEGEAGVV